MMKNLFKPLKRKLTSDLGETLVETLVAIIICVFSSTMLAGGVATASALNQKAKAQDAALSSALAVMETGKDEDGNDVDTTEGTVVISKVDDVAASTAAIDVTYINVTSPTQSDGKILVELNSYFVTDPNAPVTTTSTP